MMLVTSHPKATRVECQLVCNSGAYIPEIVPYMFRVDNDGSSIYVYN